MVESSCGRSEEARDGDGGAEDEDEPGLNSGGSISGYDWLCCGFLMIAAGRTPRPGEGNSLPENHIWNTDTGGCLDVERLHVCYEAKS